MKTSSFLSILLIILAIVWVGWYVFSRQSREVVAPTVSPTPEVTPSPSPTPQVTPSPTVTPSPKVSPKITPTPSPRADATISMVAGGFSPSQVTIRKGQVVEFRNQDTRPRWPASEIHPVHTLCLGFDSLGGVAPGESYSYTFNFDPPKACPFHDHLFPTLKGKITIQ